MLSEQEKCKNEMRSLTEKHKKVQGEHDRVNAEHGKLSREHGMFKAELGRMKSELEKLKSEHGKLKAEHKTLSQESEKLVRESGRVKNELNRVASEHDKGNTRYENLKVTLHDVQQNYECLTAEHGILKQELDKVKEDLKESQTEAAESRGAHDFVVRCIRRFLGMDEQGNTPQNELLSILQGRITHGDKLVKVGTQALRDMRQQVQSLQAEKKVVEQQLLNVAIMARRLLGVEDAQDSNDGDGTGLAKRKRAASPAASIRSASGSRCLNDVASRSATMTSNNLLQYTSYA